MWYFRVDETGRKTVSKVHPILNTHTFTLYFWVWQRRCRSRFNFQPWENHASVARSENVEVFEQRHCIMMKTQVYCFTIPLDFKHFRYRYWLAINRVTNNLNVSRSYYWANTFLRFNEDQKLQVFYKVTLLQLNVKYSEQIFHKLVLLSFSEY